MQCNLGHEKNYGRTVRRCFAKHEEIIPMPNLLEIQKKSYQWFLDTGLREVFDDVGAITDFAGNLELTFIDYSMNEPPKYSVEECKCAMSRQPVPRQLQAGAARVGVTSRICTPPHCTWAARSCCNQ